MELHLHLSRAFRALDKKWGDPIDLDTSGDSSACVPAFLDYCNTTFSSEDYLKLKKRPTPYTRYEDRRKKRENIKRKDSFSDISVSRMSSISDLRQLIEDEKINSEHFNVDSQMGYKTINTARLVSKSERNTKDKNIFSQLKESASMYKSSFMKTKNKA